MSPRRLDPGRRDERGIALLMIMWIFMILTVLTAEFSRSMRDDAVATSNSAEEVQARGVAIAGLNRAVHRAMRAYRDTTDDDVAGVGLEREVPLEEWRPDGTWHEEQYGGGTYAVRMFDEGGRVSLNRADQALLRRIFTNLGFELDAADEIVDAIIDWRDPDNLERLHGAEDEYYLGLREPYRAKNGPFDSVDELLLVRGITPELLNGTVRPGDEGDAPPVALREVFSVFNRSANINVRTAPAAVLRALLGEGEDVDEIVEARDEDPDGALALVRAKAGDATLGRRIVDRKATILAIDARAMMHLGRIEARLGAVVDLGEDGESFRILRWYDRRPAA